MHIKEITVSVARTTNLGNYESMKNEVTLSATLNSNEDYEDQVQTLYGLVEIELVGTIKKSGSKLVRE